MTSNILDTIDNALHDWETSPDAMRWTPDAAQVAPGLPMPFDVSPIVRAFEQLVAGIADMAKRAAPILQRIAHSLPDHDRARCRTCSPKANPPALCIDGREYARRRKARRH